MKILYAIQGTGNGHLSRARDIVPLLRKKGKLDILISGTQADVTLPYDIKYKLTGLSFIFGKKGSVDLWKTLKNCDFKTLIREIRTLPVSGYDLVINDFEPVSAWACLFKNVHCISLSHQAAVLCNNAPVSLKSDPIGKFILKHYAPARYAYGFHFKPYADNIFTPVIRNQVRTLRKENQGHYTVYLPSYSDKKITKFLKQFPDVKWHVFSKHNNLACTEANTSTYPINNENFIKSMATCEGVLCGAGFETPAEALFLKKKLMVIPMKNQFEQQCNAAALQSIGVPVIKSLKKKHIQAVSDWLASEKKVAVDYPDMTEEIIDQLIHKYTATAGKVSTNTNSLFRSSLWHLILKRMTA